MSVDGVTIIQDEEILLGSPEKLGKARAIETAFPYIEISKLAERESYRKEIFRPIYHIHKWWATRLGSVFRAIVLGATLDEGEDIWGSFYNKHELKDKIILDPFMGSGTTLGEAAKLGAKVIGCDINPISTFAVTQALTHVSIEQLEETYEVLRQDLEPELSRYYQTLDPQTGETIPVLYYFWVKLVTTPKGETLPLFSSYIFSKDAYPKKRPKAMIVCPSCWAIHQGRYDMDTLTCEHCSVSFNPQKGRVDGQFIKDSEGEKHKIKDLFRDGKPPEHRLYAMMALRSNGEKVYLEPRAYDFELFKSVKQRLEQEDLPLPVMSVRPGHNTNQARGYNYRTWRDFFNERQLLSLGLLLRRILQIDDEVMKDQFLCLFSSTLEYSNLFSTFKGEGTGAVRHLFSHHILKPERTPLESSVWGTPKSSGAFSTLFRTRLMKAKEYLDTPTDIFLPKDFFGNSSGTKSSYVVTSDPIHLSVTNTWGEFDHQKNAALILNGDSANLSIPDKSVDAIVTDPPYFDFVHYSELSDFFFAWLAPVLAQRYSFFTHPNSYQEGEVQSKNPENFASNLSRVLRECHRVLKDEGVLTFSFHHSRAEGWSAIYKAIKDANLQVIATYPVHAEMKVASPKSSAKEPISLDMILVCKKKQVAINKLNTLELVESAVQMYKEKLQEGKFTISEADAFNIRAALLLIFAMGEDSSVQKYQDLTKKIHFKNQITSTNQLKSSTKVLETI